MDSWEIMRLIIKSKVEREGLKQNYIAKRLGLKPNTLCAMISGKRQVTSKDIEIFCNEMKISPNELFPRVTQYQG